MDMHVSSILRGRRMADRVATLQLTVAALEGARILPGRFAVAYLGA
jgi:hypothetical protein